VAGSAVYWLESASARSSDIAASPDSERRSPADASLPTLAIVATAKDEAASVEGAARSLLAQDYPGLSLVIVDDRSMDGTGAILNQPPSRIRASCRAHRLATLRMGRKMHALARGPRHDSEWILFVDADVTLAPDAARWRSPWRARRLGSRRVGRHEAREPGEEIFVAAFMVCRHQPETVARIESAAGGTRSESEPSTWCAVRAIEGRGHEALRYELIDDMALGKILNRRGAARQTFASTTSGLGCTGIPESGA